MNLEKGVAQGNNTLGLFCIWVGGLVGVMVPMIGGMLQGGLSIAGIALAVFIGFGIVMAYTALIGMHSSDTALSIHDTAAAAMGTIAAQVLTSLPIAVASIGWFGLQAATLGAGFSAAVQGITGISVPPAVSTIVLGALTAFMAIQGFKMLKYFNYVALPLCLGIIVYVAYTLGKQGGLAAIMAYRPAQPMPLLSGVSIAVSSYALCGVIAGDYSRHANSRGSVLAGIAGIVPAACVMFCLGAAGIIAVGQSNVTALLNQWGHPVLGLVHLVLTSLSINMVNAYSGGLGVLKMLGFDESRFKVITGIACGIGVLLGASGIFALFSSFLSLVSSLIPPIAGVVIASYWLSGKGAPLPLVDIRIPGTAAFILGALTTYITGSVFPFFIPVINGLVISILSYAFLAHYLSPERANRNFKLGAKLTGGFISCALITIAAGGLGLHGLARLTTPENAAQSKDIATMMAIVMASGVALSFGLGVMFTGLVVKPIRHAFSLFKGIANGDLTQEIAITSNDEIGQMMSLLKETQQGISTLIAAVDEKAFSLSEVGVELSAMMTQAAAAVHQITANTQGMNNKTLIQAAGVNQTNAIMGQIVTHINSINQHIEEQLHSVSRAAAAVEQMTAHSNAITGALVHNKQNVQDLAQASAQGKLSLQAVSRDIQEVAEESANLLQINAIIRTIASQTNFLSMNAAIEAAHAGVAGAGFAVVAEEIHRLAESSAEQVTIISRALKHITTSIDRIHGATGQVIVHFEDIDRRVKTVVSQEQQIMERMEQQDAGCKELVGMIRVSKDLSENVQFESEQMLQGSKEVITEGKNLDALTMDLTNGIGEIAAGMNQINRAVSRVSEIAVENKESIAVLVQSLSRFKYSA
ncbi:MAG: methyl-accepting chemotaxis protein [Treponema sp.]|jgi:purine-cytosine permease-like protein/methyl-accepting chemotaxis protein|nr:methyl-accepting chemotaxis protein [Treponema sp.]